MSDLAALRTYVDAEVTDWPNHDPSESFDEGWDAAKGSCLNAIERYAANVRMAAPPSEDAAPLRDAAQAVVDAWDGRDPFRRIVPAVAALRAALEPEPK